MVLPYQFLLSIEGVVTVWLSQTELWVTHTELWVTHTELWAAHTELWLLVLFISSSV